MTKKMKKKIFPTGVVNKGKTDKKKLILLIGINENMSQKFSAPSEQLKISLHLQNLSTPSVVFCYLFFLFFVCFFFFWVGVLLFILSAPISLDIVYKTEIV